MRSMPLLVRQVALATSDWHKSLNDAGSPFNTVGGNTKFELKIPGQIDRHVIRYTEPGGGVGFLLTLHALSSGS